MRKNSPARMISFLFLIVVLSLGCDGNRGTGVESDKGEGVQAPEFQLLNLDGETVRLSDYAGKIVVLNFWATWCAPCRIEIPSLIELYSRYRSREVTVIGIAMDPVGPDSLKEFAGEAGINYPVLVGDEKVSSEYGGIFGIPTTFIISRKGVITNRHVGVVNETTLEQEILALLAK